MSSSENEDVSHSNHIQSPEQEERQIASVLDSIERVRHLIDAEVEIADFNCRQAQPTSTIRPAHRLNSLIYQRVAYFESKSTPNLSSGSTCWLSGLPLYQPKFSPEKAVASVPTSPRGRKVTKQVRSVHFPPRKMAELAELNRSLETVPHRPDDGVDNGEDESQTPQWDRYEVRLKIYLRALEKDTLLMRRLLNDTDEPPTPYGLRTLQNEVKSHHKELDAYKEEFHQAAMGEAVPEDTIEQVTLNLRAATKELIKISTFIDMQITAPITPASTDLSLANIMSAVQNVAHSPLLKLPLFHGDIANYAAFKKNFEYLIKQVTGPKELWATHLAGCMRSEAKQYIGDSTQWFDKYEELWEMLDIKYANRWVLATDTIRAFFLKAPPPSELEEVKKWFFDMQQALNKVIALGMSVEEIGINFVIECLPDEYQTELRNGLRTLHPGQKTATFSKKTVQEVFNDTIGVRKETPSNSHLKGTLSLLAQTAGNKQQQQQKQQRPPQ